MEAATTEYAGGQAQSGGRAFPLLWLVRRGFPRLCQPVAQQSALWRRDRLQDGAEFAKGLQRAGYATDPAYADKLNRIINGPTLRRRWSAKGRVVPIPFVLLTGGKEKIPGSGLISIAMTGINAAQAGLLTTGNKYFQPQHRGYSTRQRIQASNPSVMTGAGGIGQGACGHFVERMFSQAPTTQGAQCADQCRADTHYARPDNMLADKGSRLDADDAEVFRCSAVCATNPSSISAHRPWCRRSETMTVTMYERPPSSGDVSQIDRRSPNRKIISAGAIGGQPAK